MVDRKHDIIFDNLPTILEEGPGEAIGARGFVTRKIKNRPLDLLLREGSPKVREITCGDRDIVPIDVNVSGRSALGDLGEMVLNDGPFMIMFGDPSVVVLETMNEVLSSSMVDSKMEEASVSISVLEVGDSRTLPFPCTLKHGQTNHFPLEPRSNVALVNTKRSKLLGHIQP